MAEALGGFHFPDDLWARCIYDLIIATRRGEVDTGQMVAALTPIYFGRVGSFVIENRHVTTSAAEERVERQAREFELLKPYLVQRWNEEAPRDGRAAPQPDPDPGREPAHRGGADPDRRLLLEPRTGELTALGIVEVPEGMPLSEGATRARQARRLLQKVLDYAPEGTVIHPLVRIGRHAAAGIVEAAAEQEADLMIFGWGGKSEAAPGRRRTRDLADDRRGRARGAVRHRGRQAARRPGHPADPRPRPRRSAREPPCGSRTRWRSSTARPSR